MTPLPAAVVAARSPPTVTVPLSVIPAVAPLVNVRSPTMVDAAMMSAVVPPSMMRAASVPELSFGVIVYAPGKALSASFNVIVASLALVTRVLVPPTATSEP